MKVSAGTVPSTAVTREASQRVLTSTDEQFEQCLNLRTRHMECYDYNQSRLKKGTVPLCERDSPLFHNPPVLHRKESFLLPEHELHAKFARLTAQEEKHG